MTFADAMTARDKFISWAIFLALSIIWGSSFILMKLGMYTSTGEILLSPYQVASVRILSAGLVLMPFIVRSVKSIPKKKIGYVMLSGLLGSFFPAYFFCIAETKIDSSLAGALNALTPIFVISSGLLLYNSKVSSRKIMGILIGLAGSILLLLTKQMKTHENIFYSAFVVLATLCYGINVNMARQRLQDISSLHIATMAFVALFIPSLLILIFTGYFSLPVLQPAFLQATIASAFLGISSTAIATILFYVLLKKAGTIFASMVTYGVPFVAIAWGYVLGEQVTFLQIISLAIILAGVYITNK